MNNDLLMPPTVVATFSGGPMNKQQRTIPSRDEIIYTRDQYTPPARYARQGPKTDGTWNYIYMRDNTRRA